MALQQLDSAVIAYRGAAYSSATKQAYSSQYLAYMKFCDYFGFKPLPASQQQLCRYVAFLATYLSYSSIEKYLNIVRIMHLEAGLNNPCDNSWPLSTVLRGVKRVKGTAQRCKQPITPQIMCDIYRKLDLSNTFHVAFWAACLCAFFTFFRKSTLLLPGLAFTATEHSIRRADVSFHTNGVVFHVTHTKTIQFGERAFDVPVPVIPGSVLCPVRALRQMWELTANVPSSAPVFCYAVPGDKWRPLTQGQFASALKHTLRACGYDSTELTPHSFRHGGMSYCFQIGLPLDLIKEHGDWHSNAYQRYLHVPDSQRWQLATAVSKSLQPNSA